MRHNHGYYESITWKVIANVEREEEERRGEGNFDVCSLKFANLECGFPWIFHFSQRLRVTFSSSAFYLYRNISTISVYYLLIERSWSSNDHSCSNLRINVSKIWRVILPKWDWIQEYKRNGISIIENLAKNIFLNEKWYLNLTMGNNFVIIHKREVHGLKIFFMKPINQ